METTKKPPNYRCTFSLPVPLATGITRVSKTMGISQSALLSELLSSPIADLNNLCDLFPPDEPITPEKLLRARGASLAVVAQRVSEALANVGAAPDPDRP